jgi:DNA-binding Lrp family transcriptional regulator
MWKAGVNRVVEAFMLIQTEVGRAEVVAKQVATLPGVLSSEYVTGPYDVVVRVGAETMGSLQTDVVASVQAVEGITRTLTCPIANGAGGLETA